MVYENKAKNCLFGHGHKKILYLNIKDEKQINREKEMNERDK